MYCFIPPSGKQIIVWYLSTLHISSSFLQPSYLHVHLYSLMVFLHAREIADGFLLIIYTFQLDF